MSSKLEIHTEIHTQIIYIQCDISLKDKLRNTFDEIASIFRKIDVLIHAAGIFNDTDVEHVELSLSLLNCYVFLIPVMSFHFCM